MKKYVNKITLLFIIALLVTNCEKSNQNNIDNNQTYPIGKSLKWGNYIVGFQNISETDYSRVSSLPDKENRKIDFGIWYPAQTGNDKRIIYSDYLNIIKDKSIDSIKLDYLNQKSFLGEVDTLLLSKYLSITTNAFHEAQPLYKSFPLIVYAGKANDFVYGNTFLFEYLASHGYVILSIPPKIPNAEQETMPLNNLNDMYFAINYVKQFLPSVDVSKMATIGYEIGSVSTVALTIENPNIKAHISLQGAVGSNFGWSFSQSLHNNSLSDLKVPILHFGSNSYEKEPKYSMGEATFETADSINKAKRYFSFLEKSVPLGVSSHLVMSWVHPLTKIKNEYKIDKSGIDKGYEDLVRQTLDFLNLYVKKNGNITSFEKTILESHKNNFIKKVEQDSIE